jgi:iron complex transport system ATP-binding protein
MPILTFEKATFGYGNKPVLQDVSLRIEEGEILAIVGPNGVGKSTLIKAASGILPLTHGRVQINGSPLQDLHPSQRAKLVTVVPQGISLPPAFSARDVVLMGRTPYLGWLSKEDQTDLQIAKEAMVCTHTAQLAERPLGELSGGEQQRVLIARALAQSAPVMLLDEPTAHLDLRHQDELLKLVHALAKEENLSILITLHDLNLVARFADRVALLSNGRVKKIGLPEQVLTPEELAAVYGVEIHVTSHPIHGTPLVLPG